MHKCKSFEMSRPAPSDAPPIRSQLLIFPNRSTHWKPHIQIHTLMGNILLQTITVVSIVLEASTKAVSHSNKSYNICT